MQTLKEALAKANIPLTPEEELKEREELEVKHRGKAVLERPKEEVNLYHISRDIPTRKKVQADPTDDLVNIPIGIASNNEFPHLGCGYIVVCKDTMQVWYAVNKGCLDENFIYRDDLYIKDLDSCEDPSQDAWEFYKEMGVNTWNPGIETRKKCYILDNPGNETYEVYYETNYPSLHYGKATPNGMFIHAYENRFHRDMAIMELDEIYNESSKKRAKEYTKKELKSNEAIVISDGCWMKETCASSCWYLDNEIITQISSAKIPSEPDQAVLISEITGATLALQYCILNGKKNITYYYDNTSILNVFRNRKTEYIEEIKKYKELLEDMDSKGYKINFVELHPKTGEDRDKENRALMFFHNGCDRACREMSEIFKKDYRTYACGGSTDGKTYYDVKNEFKPKGAPKQGGYKKPGQNFKPRNHY